MRVAKYTFFKNMSMGSKRNFWKTVKYMNKQQTSIPTLNLDGISAVTNQEKATVSSLIALIKAVLCSRKRI